MSKDDDVFGKRGTDPTHVRWGVDEPKLGKWYRAGNLPAGSVVSATTQTEYVIGRSHCCMRWEQPIPRSEDWWVRYEGRLPLDVWMTHRERAEVDEIQRRHESDHA